MDSAYKKEQIKNGRKGGQVVLKKYGKKFLRKIAKLGAKKRWENYYKNKQ